MEKLFVTAINCIDGRAQEPIINYLKAHYKVDYVDMITEPGPNKILSDNRDNITIESIKKRAEISITKHQSGIIAIVGHYDCAGNPKSEEMQKMDLLKAINVIEAWELKVKEVVAFWLDENFYPTVVDSNSK